MTPVEDEGAGSTRWKDKVVTSLRKALSGAAEEAAAEARSMAQGAGGEVMGFVRTHLDRLKVGVAAAVRSVLSQAVPKRVGTVSALVVASGAALLTWGTWGGRVALAGAGGFLLGAGTAAGLGLWVVRRRLDADAASVDDIGEEWLAELSSKAGRSS